MPPDHPESNFGVAYGMLISQLPRVRPDRIHRMPAEADDLDAAGMRWMRSGRTRGSCEMSIP